MQFATDKKFGRRVNWAASASILVFILVPVSLAIAQQAVVRDLCSSGRWISVAAIPTPTAPTQAPNPVALDSAEEAPVANAPTPSPISVHPIEIAKTDRCVHPSPIGVVYNPELTAKVRRQYENSLINAEGVTKEAAVSNVILSASVDVTTPPPIFYDREEGRNDGLTFISLTGGITNNNPFPLSSLSIQCDYSDAVGVSQSFELQFPYTLGPKGGHIPLQAKVIDVLPPRSVVNDISCKVETAEIWKNTDAIQYLNAPLNPNLRPSVPIPGLSRLDVE